MFPKPPFKPPSMTMKSDSDGPATRKSKPTGPREYSEAQRMELRGIVNLAGEIIAYHWPMRTFIHHNILHGLESLDFEEAVRLGRTYLGGNGFLSNERFRDYYRSGRILPKHIDAAIKPVIKKTEALFGGRAIRQEEVVKAHLLHGISSPEALSLTTLVNRASDRPLLETLAARLVNHSPTNIETAIETRVSQDRTALGNSLTLATWCDRTLNAGIMENINREIIKWSEAFLDEGHAPWPMPDREKGFYLAWKGLARREWFQSKISGGPQKAGRLPDRPEDALLHSLEGLGIPKSSWQSYLSLHLGTLFGWAGFIKWRANQSEYSWQRAYPIDSVQYLAVRLWYEREHVDKTCRDELGINGTWETVSTFMERNRHAYFLRSERTAGHLPWRYTREVDSLRHRPPEKNTDRWQLLANRYLKEEVPRQEHLDRLSAAWRLWTLAKIFEIDPARLVETPLKDLRTILGWLDAFPESTHGIWWLAAFEAGYEEELIKKLIVNSSSSPERTEKQGDPPVSRPQAQAVFCIDVRSESYRRHLEHLGDYETFGFAGFFTAFIRYRGFGDHHETDQFPVVMKAKNRVREIPRSYQGALLSRHRAGLAFVHAVHRLLHDLKEHVITPFVMVESLGWFLGLPFFAKTLFPVWYQKSAAWMKRKFSPPVATTLTVDKLSKKEAEEILAAEERAVVRQALRERFGRRGERISAVAVEALRWEALGEKPPVATTDNEFSIPLKLSLQERTLFLQELRHRYRINGRMASSRLERLTLTGYTLLEQVYTVETALRMMGLTARFARLVLLCGHGSTSENNPFESALDCGACGGNNGRPNARVFAAMANRPQVRESLLRKGIAIPYDTCFIAAQINTTTDEPELFDLEDLPPTHLKELSRLIQDLKAAGVQNAQERSLRFPEINKKLPPRKAARHVRRRSADWSQVRPEWGLSGNGAIIIGRRELTREADLEGRVFLHSYDHRLDPTGTFLEIIMTGPQVVAQWINMEHYFSTVDNTVYGSGSKIYHNVVGRIGIMLGPQSDLRVGLSPQTVMNGERPYHEPMRLLTLIEAPPERILSVVRRHPVLQDFYHHRWVRLIALGPSEGRFFRYFPNQGWVLLDQDPRMGPPETNMEPFILKE